MGRYAEIKRLAKGAEKVEGQISKRVVEVVLIFGFDFWFPRVESRK